MPKAFTIIIMACLILTAGINAQITAEWHAIGSAGGVAEDSQKSLKSMLGFISGGFSSQDTKLLWCGVRFSNAGLLADIGDEEDAQVPFTFALNQNYPNPFNPSTRIQYSLAKRSQVTLIIYNILGQRVASLVDGDQEAGEYLIDWDGQSDSGSETATGVYFYRIIAGNFTKVQKMILIK